MSESNISIFFNNLVQDLMGSDTNYLSKSASVDFVTDLVSVVSCDKFPLKKEAADGDFVKTVTDIATHPATIGGGIGAVGGYLATPEDKNNKWKKLRNAVLGAAVGAGGTYSVMEGTKMLMNAKGPKEPTPWETFVTNLKQAGKDTEGLFSKTVGAISAYKAGKHGYKKSLLNSSNANQAFAESLGAKNMASLTRATQDIDASIRKGAWDSWKEAHKNITTFMKNNPSAEYPNAVKDFEPLAKRMQAFENKYPDAQELNNLRKDIYAFRDKNPVYGDIISNNIGSGSTRSLVDLGLDGKSNLSKLKANVLDYVDSAAPRRGQTAEKAWESFKKETLPSLYSRKAHLRAGGRAAVQGAAGFGLGYGGAYLGSEYLGGELADIFNGPQPPANK